MGRRTSTTTTTTTTTSTTTTTPAPTSADKQQQLSKINKSVQETWLLHTVSMLQQDSLVLVDIAWDSLNAPSQCLISWEVSGGGLMGNLLTESSSVQLSLWPDTKYRVKVTCKNKFTGFMTRSLPLSIDTSEAVNANDQHKTKSPSGEVITTQSSGSKDNAHLKMHPDFDNSDIMQYDNTEDEQDQSADTNFIFNWHSKNKDISAIEPVQKPDINMLTLTALAEIEKPLLFGLTAGIILLTLIVAMYLCLIKRNKLLHDKSTLITDPKIHAIVTTMSPAVLAAARAKAAKRKTKERNCGESILMADAATSLAHQRGNDAEEEGEAKQGYVHSADEVCSNPAICSRNALKV